MPYPMIHFAVAGLAVKRGLSVRNLPDFYTGVLAPDAIHLRSGQSGEVKKRSHLCVGDEAWGEITNNVEWTRNVLSRFSFECRAADRDFSLGYCVHILTDICWNELVYTSFRKKYAKTTRPDSSRRETYEKNCRFIEQALFRTAGWKNDVWTILSSARGHDLPGLIRAEEAERWLKTSMTQIEALRESAPPVPQYFTVNLIDRFIAQAADKICTLLDERTAAYDKD